MNPIFIAHLTADFLLQPKWLAEWKQKSLGGVLFHSLMHAIVLFLLVIPADLGLAVALIVLALIHGAVDYIKIRIQPTHTTFEPMFLLDQAIHLGALAIFSIYTEPGMTFWQTENGIIGLKVLWFLSFGVAMWNLRKLNAFPIKTPHQSIARFATITIIFIGLGLAGFFV
jgi:hypothetical protein